METWPQVVSPESIRISSSMVHYTVRTEMYGRSGDWLWTQYGQNME